MLMKAFTQFDTMILSFIKIIIRLMLLGIAANSWASTEQSLTLPLTFEYQSNPQFVVTGSQAVNYINFTPAYSITSSDGSDQWGANISVHMQRSSNKAISDDRADPAARLNWVHDYETGQFSIIGNSHIRSTRLSEITDSGLLYRDNTQKLSSLIMSWRNVLSERSTLTFSGSTTNVTFAGENTSGLINYTNNFISGRYDYVLTERTSVFTNLSMSRYLPKSVNNTNIDTASFDVGTVWNVNQELNLTASVGANDVRNYSATTASHNKGWQANINMQYTTPRTSSHIGVSRQIEPGSTGSVSETSQLVFGSLYHLSERDSISANVNVTENIVLNNTDIKIKTKTISASYNNELSSEWNFRLSATHMNRDDNTSSVVENNTVMASIIYNISGF